MPRRPLLIICAVALLVRVALVVATPDFVPFGDPADYDRLAASIAAGKGYPPTTLAEPGTAAGLRAPGWPHVLGAVYAVTGARWTAGRLLAAVLGALTVALLMLIAHRVWGRRVAIVAGALAAVYPPLVMLNGTLLSEPLFLPLMLGALAAVLEARQRGGSLRWAALAGVLCGGAALTRSMGVAFVALAAVAVWAAVPRPRLAPRALAGPAVLGLAAALTIAPWTIRNAVQLGAFVPVTTGSGYSLVGAYNTESRTDDELHAVWRQPEALVELGPRRLFHRPGLDEVELDKELGRVARGHARADPAQVVEAAWLNSRRLFVVAGPPLTRDLSYKEMAISSALKGWVTLSVWLMTLVAVVGGLALFGPARVRRRLGGAELPRGPWVLWAVPLLMLAITAPIVGSPRYRAPLDPFLCLLAAVALASLPRSLLHERLRHTRDKAR